MSLHSVRIYPSIPILVWRSFFCLTSLSIYDTDISVDLGQLPNLRMAYLQCALLYRDTFNKLEYLALQGPTVPKPTKMTAPHLKLFIADAWGAARDDYPMLLVSDLEVVYSDAAELNSTVDVLKKLATQ